MRFAWCFAVSFVLNLVVAQTAVADSLGEKFKRWVLGNEAQAAMLDDFDPETDRIVQGCTQCHDGSRAAHIAVKDAEMPLQYSSSGVQINHPIGMDYDYYAARKNGSYKPRHSLDPNIILIDGRVTCVSCHRLKGTARSDTLFEWRGIKTVTSVANNCSASKRLTVGPRQTDLCLACHNK